MSEMYPVSRLSYKKLKEVALMNASPQAFLRDSLKEKYHHMSVEPGDDSEISEANTDVEVDDILQKNGIKAKTKSKDDSKTNSHIFGSLLELTHKLHDTERRYQKMVKAMEAACELSLAEDSASNSACTGHAACGQMNNANKKPAALPKTHNDQVSKQQCTEDPPVLHQSNLLFTHRNGSDTHSAPAVKSISTLSQDFSPAAFKTHAAAKDLQQSQTPVRAIFDGINVAGLLSNVVRTSATSVPPVESKGETVLSERRKHRCQMCTYQTDNISHLRRHQCTVHNADKLYHCYVCGMDFSRSERAKAHFLTIHPEIPYHSKKARKRPGDSLDCTLMMKSVKPDEECHVPEKIVVPKHFSGSVTTRKSWEKYCQLVPPANGSGSYHFKCLQCEHQGPNIWHLKRHFLDTHVSSGSYSCRVCHYSTGDVQRLISHMTGHGELFCSRCPFSTVELERFRAHLPLCNGSSSGVNEFSQCPVCGDEFADRLSVKSHVSLAHQRDYCDLCGCVIYGSETMEEHLLHHANSDWNGSTAEVPAGPSSLDNLHSTSGGCSSIDGAQINGSETSLDHCDTEGQLADEIHQAKIRFGRFSNQVYYCPVEGCGFKATWKKSVELHTLNYHGCGNADDHADGGQLMCDQSPAVGGTTPMMYGLFNCAFCPNHRTFKYRKSFEKHLLQHGIDYEKHPYLVVRCSQSVISGGLADGMPVLS